MPQKVVCKNYKNKKTILNLCKVNLKKYQVIIKIRNLSGDKIKHALLSF